MGFGFKLSLIFWTWFGVTANTYDFELEDRWSQEVLSEGLCRYGNRVECCWGWRPIDWGRCEPSCHQECKHGQCVGPDRCQCHPGYTGKTCNQDLNECGLSPRPCKHRCVNTHGSFKCYCPTGYTELPDGGCQNARTCALSNCQYGCELTKGVVRCTCPSPGLRLGPDRRTCVDINECVSGGGVCPRRRKCVNTFSSFLCKCHQGFRLRYINGRYTCIDKDTRPFCTLNPGSPKCQCRDGPCKAVAKVTLEPARHWTTTQAPRGTTTSTVKPITRPFTKPLPRKTTTTTTVTTTTSGTASVPATTSSMATTFLTTTISPTTTEMTTELTTTTIPTTTPPKPTTTTTQKTTTTRPTTAPETPLIPTTPQPTTTTTQKTTTTSPTTAPETTPLKPTTPQPTTTTTQRTTTTTTQRTTTTIQTTEFIPTTSESTTMPIPTTTIVALTTSPTPTTTVAVMTTLVTTVPPPTTYETTTTTTTASTVAVTTPSTTTLDNRIQKEVTRKRGDVHIPRQPDQNQVWEFDIELGNTAEDDFRDDPAAGVLHCSFEQGVCSWISDQDGDLPWNTVHHHSTGGSYLTVPELKAGQRSTRGARLVVPVLPPWNHGDLCFSFSHWLTGHHVGLLQVFVKKRGRGQRYSPALWSRTGGHGWRHTHISLRGEEVDRVLLKGERRRGGKGEVAVDDVTLRRGPCPHGNTIRRH